ncbi:uncharacterized protein B0P05DRAFT_539770 [Gilbertella persicaria]|uniref:uncharacterized protein n=1 Tax=Gilbertella persicaria TaxID=101096 RepID=UPI002220A42D|nr:uncharacterized protein B0P05DRAFT_539770 [Gilbertella persicaria]KAI8080827.1 hypothetical protein B0P05DRAFT_539770 [Gilbertella persicaria]
MYNTDIVAPGEKVDIHDESTYNYIPYNDIKDSSPNTSSDSSPFERKRRVSTAHIMPNDFPDNQVEEFAYDELVSKCASFLGSPIVNEIVTQFASNVLTIIGSPNVLESKEVKRRLEQVLPTSHEYKYHRGMEIPDNDCVSLCSLADRAINVPVGSPTNVDIVDDDNDEEEVEEQNLHDVYYVRQLNKNTQEHDRLPRQLPSFVEVNEDLDKAIIEYDLDVTPYDSELEEPPIRMQLV